MALIQIDTTINYLVTWFRGTKNIHMNVQDEDELLNGTTIFEGNSFEYYANESRANVVQYIEDNNLQLPE